MQKKIAQGTGHVVEKETAQILNFSKLRLEDLCRNFIEQAHTDDKNHLCSANERKRTVLITRVNDFGSTQKKPASND
ncbi:hypothetical protein [Pseudomonas sp. W2I6]|jgi:hypothetical protein|uniref:hypothetical protein n=1 Tax=Pseudomonas TaxID=286 RepID=UPI002789C409|nr:hypothetical protein [Pseudomonas sp. W2I6]MDQ0666644.1 hypothetical protein [Pseudomonas sp. W2I6]